MRAIFFGFCSTTIADAGPRCFSSIGRVSISNWSESIACAGVGRGDGALSALLSSGEKPINRESGQS